MKQTQKSVVNEVVPKSQILEQSRFSKTKQHDILSLIGEYNMLGMIVEEALEREKISILNKCGLP
ncbi:MAG: hypothetical protein LBG27_05150 [Spirochaetaceae bacterium]|nr:hypothetical protein [Spirochaetaceae bacterium]